MKKGIKTFCKVLSVFLAVLFVIEILPLQVMAEDFTEAVAKKEFIEDLVNNPTDAEKDADAEILYEVEEKRDEYTKVYKKSDGTYTAVMTEEPLHYLDEGVWKEIDNSMILDGSLYTNLSNLFNVELPKNIDENKELTVEKDGYELSFSVDNIENSSAVVENNIVASDTEIESADKAISQTQSSVTYNDIADNTNLQYIVTPNSIKENIIVSNKESVKDTYTFTFETNGLNAEKQDDGSVIFKDTNGDVKFTIPRPVMTDSNFAFSYDISVSLTENANGTVTLEYTPSIDWISSNDRLYPITIDPAIVVEVRESGWVEDTSVISISSDENSTNENFYGEGFGVVGNRTLEDGDAYIGEVYTKINVDDIKAFGTNVVVTEAQYMFATLSFDGNALAKKIAEPIDFSTITYATKPDLEDEVFDYHTSLYTDEDYENNTVKPSYAHFNITKPINDWLNGETNNGFAVVAGNEGYLGVYFTNVENTSVTSTTVLLLDFIDAAGNSSYFNYHSQSAGRAGTGYVSDFTQSLSVIRDDLSIDGNIMPVTVGMTYNFAQEFLTKYYGAIATDFYCGLNWVPNYHRMVAKLTDEQILYYTDKGSLITFDLSTDEDGKPVLKETNADIYGESGYTAEFVAKEDGTYSTTFDYLQITRPDGYIERFYSNGYLKNVSNPDEPEQKISVYYEYPNYFGRIDCITDGVGRKYDYIYNDSANLLTKVKCYSANGTEILAGTTDLPLEINYTYDENRNLTGVTFPDGKTVNYEYDANGNMTSMTNIDGYRVKYEYNSNERITKITEQAYDGTNYIDGKCLTYERLSATQVKLTDGNGQYEIYQFGNKGNRLYVIDDSSLIQSGMVDENNCIENGGFESGLEGWQTQENLEIIESTIIGQKVAALKLHGGIDAENTIYQTVEINGKKNDVIAVAGWFKGYFTNSATNNSLLCSIIKKSTSTSLFNFTNDRYAQIELAYQYKISDGNEEKLVDERMVIPFSENIDDWQYISDGLTLKGDCETLTLIIRYSKNVSQALISNIELTKNGGYDISYYEDVANDATKLLKSLSLGLRDVISYDYNEYGKISRIVYNNNAYEEKVMDFEYTGNQVTKIKVNGKTKYQFLYDNSVLTGILSGDDRIIRYADDTTGLSSFINSYYNSVRNEEGNPVEMFDGKGYETQLYDVDYNISIGESVEKSEVFVENNKAIGISSTQDLYGRRLKNLVVAQDPVADPNQNFVTIESAFEYDGDNTEFNNLNQVKAYTNKIYDATQPDSFLNSKSFFYEYDENGNIIKEYDYISENSMGLRYSYSYDSQSRLIRYDDNVSNPNRSYSFEYDNYGNLVSKSTYTYTPLETELGEPISTEYYNVATASLDNEIIIWNGQELESYERTDENNITTRVEYSYDENSLMTEKKVYIDNALNETYYYTWAYGKLTNQVYIKEGATPTKHTIKYVYDSFNSVQGFILDHTETFLFQKNLFGDIIGIVDSSGNIVVSYEYTPWGVPTITCDDNEISSADIIKMLPLTYRGCSYDYYSGLYCVEGRYYNPKVGKIINSNGTEDNENGLSESPANYSLFTYWENHPLWYVDSDAIEIINANSIANYLYNKQLTNDLSNYYNNTNGFIFNQTSDIVCDYRYGFNTVGPYGCGLVATYNALLLLENQTEAQNVVPMNFHDVIREYEQSGLLAYGCWGLHPLGIAQFFIERDYDVNISFDKMIYDTAIQNSIASVLFYTYDFGNHYVAVEHDAKEYLIYNLDSNTNVYVYDKTIENFVSSKNSSILISIS